MTLDAALFEQQLEALERPRSARRPILPWVLIVVGLLVMVGLGVHASFAYRTITQINDTSKIDSPNPVLMFQDVATNGPRIGATVPGSSRSTYQKALEQFLLDSTGIALAIVLVVGGVFIRVNL